MKVFYVTMILFLSFLFIGFGSADGNDAAEALPAEAVPAELTAPTAEVASVPENVFPEINAGAVASELLGGGTQLTQCFPDDPNYCESAADCPIGCPCRLNCCGD